MEQAPKTYLIMAFIPTDRQADGFGGGPIEWSGSTDLKWNYRDNILSFIRKDGRLVVTNLPVIIEEE